MENIIKFLFPQSCIFCGMEGDIFCDICLSECRLLENQFCVVCDQQSERGITHGDCLIMLKNQAPTSMLAVYSYEGKVRECIKFSKYGGKQFLSLRKLSYEAVGVAFETWGSQGADIVLPIPSSPKKLAFRGFNQANMISEEVSKRFSIPMRKDVLFRGRSTEAQHMLGKLQRAQNLSGAFVVKDPSIIKEARVLLVDDICTTGATFLEAAKTLYEAGARDVTCFALSKREKFCYNN